MRASMVSMTHVEVRLAFDRVMCFKISTKTHEYVYVIILLLFSLILFANMPLHMHAPRIISTRLEAQWRYFSYRAILAAIVSQNSFVLVFVGYRTIIARYVAKWGIAQMCLCETKHQGGVSHYFGGVLISLKKYRAIWGIAAIVSQYRAIWGH